MVHGDVKEVLRMLARWMPLSLGGLLCELLSIIANCERKVLKMRDFD